MWFLLSSIFSQPGSKCFEWIDCNCFCCCLQLNIWNCQNCVRVLCKTPLVSFIYLKQLNSTVLSYFHVDMDQIKNMDFFAEWMLMFWNLIRVTTEHSYEKKRRRRKCVQKILWVCVLCWVDNNSLQKKYLGQWTPSFLRFSCDISQNWFFNLQQVNYTVFINVNMTNE